MSLSVAHAATEYLPVKKLRADDERYRRKYLSGDLRVIESCDSHCSERSLKWIPKLERLHEDKGVFAVVGVAHLAGRSGLISILKSRGSQVVQIKSLSQLKRILKNEKRRL